MSATSVRFNNAAQYLIQTTGLPAGTPLTRMFWMKLLTDANVFRVVTIFANSAASSKQNVELGSNGTSLNLVLTGSTVIGQDLTLNTWYHVCHVRNGSAHTLYLNGTQIATGTDATTFTTGLLLIGGDTVNGADMRITSEKIWTAALSAAEIAAEMPSYTPVRSSNVWAWYPFISASDVTDHSGNSHNYTANGSIVTETDAPTTLSIKQLAGTAAGTSSAGTSKLTAQRILAAVSSKAAVVTGALTTLAGPKQLAGIITGSAVTTGLLTAKRRLLGSIVGASSTQGALAASHASYKLGIIGDSGMDEYRADNARGGTYGATTFGPAELLVRLRPQNFYLGEWATGQGEPRRDGYTQNWARDGATAGSVFAGSYVAGDITDGQITGCAAQVSAAQVNTVLIWIGANDIAEFNNTRQDVANGTVAGSNLTAKINSILDNIAAAADAVISAGCNRVMVTNILDPSVSGEMAAAGYTSTQQSRIHSFCLSVNSGIASLVSARPQCALVDRNNTGLLTAIYPVTGGTGFTVGGEFIDATTLGDEPHHFQLADAHYGTVASGMEANAYIIDTLNNSFGGSVQRFTDDELLTQSGISSILLFNGVTSRAATTSAKLTASRILTGTTSRAAATAAGLVCQRVLAGTTSKAAVTTGSMGLLKRLQASTAVSAVVSGGMSCLRAVAGFTSRSALVSGALSAVRTMAGSTSQTAIASGRLSAIRRLQATTAGLGQVLTDWYQQGVVALGAICSTGATVLGSLSVRRALGGTTAPAAAVVSGRLTAIRRIQALTNGAGQVIADLTRITGLNALAGVIAGSSTVRAGLVVARSMRGGVVSASSAVAGLAVRRLFNGISNGIGSALGLLGGTSSATPTPMRRRVVVSTAQRELSVQSHPRRIIVR